MLIMDLIAVAVGLLAGAYIMDHLILPMFRKDPAYRWIPIQRKRRQ